MKAARRFDETRGFKFISYAVWWIRQSILQALAEQSRIVRLPLNKLVQSIKINKAYALLEQQLERPPTAEEVAKELDLTEDEVKQAMKNSGRHVSMDAPLVEGEDSNMYNVIGSEDSPNPDEGLYGGFAKTRNWTSSSHINPKRRRSCESLFWFEWCSCHDP